MKNSIYRIFITTLCCFGLHSTSFSSVRAIAFSNSTTVQTLVAARALPTDQVAIYIYGTKAGETESLILDGASLKKSRELVQQELTERNPNVSSEALALATKAFETDLLIKSIENGTNWIPIK